MHRLGMSHDPSEDFDHPDAPEGHELSRHVLYRLPARTRSSGISSDAAHALAGENHGPEHQFGQEKPGCELDGQEREQHDKLRRRSLVRCGATEDQADEGAG